MKAQKESPRCTVCEPCGFNCRGLPRAPSLATHPCPSEEGNPPSPRLPLSVNLLLIRRATSMPKVYRQSIIVLDTVLLSGYSWESNERATGDCQYSALSF